MSSLGMNGTYILTNEKIDEVVTKKSPGNYALSKSSEGTFYINYVGRSDTDLNQELKAQDKKIYKRFKFSYATSPKAAFEKECKNYHDFGENVNLDNEIHPDRPDNADWKCPNCNNLD